MRLSVLRHPLSLHDAGLFLFCLLAVSGLNTVAKADTDSVTVNFSATFIAPTCTMTVPSTIDFTSDGTGLQSVELVGDGVTYPGGLTISFNKCSNPSFTTALPKITVKGRTIQLGGTDYYFADQPNSSGEYTANGYGLKLSVSGQPLFADNSNIAVVGGSQGGGVIQAKTGNTIDSLNGTSLNLTAQLSCGSYSPCSSAPDHEVGSFKATVTFQLAYD
ncbi:TPA: hypothetical protein PC537_003942 [Morganella morganii]|nr:hypothetical protein [Morganella morganii]